MPEKQALRDELEATRAAYHELLASLTDANWKRKSGNPDLTIKELMWHMAWSMGWISGSIDAVRSGKDLRAPGFVIEPARKLAMRWLARAATPQRAAQRYDAGHTALLAKLAAVSDDDWQRSAKRFGAVRTVEWYFRHPREHFEEHAADVRRGLPASQPR